MAPSAAASALSCSTSPVGSVNSWVRPRLDMVAGRGLATSSSRFRVPASLSTRCASARSRLAARSTVASYTAMSSYCRGRAPRSMLPLWTACSSACRRCDFSSSTDHPSTMMWWAVKSTTWSSSASVKEWKRARGPAAMSNGVASMRENSSSAEANGSSTPRRSMTGISAPVSSWSTTVGSPRSSAG